MRRKNIKTGAALSRALESMQLSLTPSEFKKGELAAAERVVWTFPDVDPEFEFRSKQPEDLSQAIQHEPHGPVAREVNRIVVAYRESFMDALKSHERSHNRGRMPEVTVARPQKPRFFIQHLAQVDFATMLDVVLTDVTEEDPLLHPKGQS
jgi:hypothetical protein